MSLFCTLVCFVLVTHFRPGESACVGTNAVPKNGLEEAIPRYKFFVDGVFGTLSELGENSTADYRTTESDLEGGSVASLLGISHILAAVKEQKWAVSYPLFGRLMENVSSWDLLGALNTVANTTDETIKVNTLMFLPAESHTEYKTAPLEVTTLDFDEDDTTVPYINDRVANLTEVEMPGSYIEEGVLIPSSTLMIVINIVQAKLPWPPGSWELIGLRQFNKKQYGQVVQLTGNVRYAEGNGEIDELFLQFDDGIGGGLALRMPRDIAADRSVANLEGMNILKPSLVTVRIPVLNYFLRSNYELTGDNETMCDFGGVSNMLQLLDVLSHVRLDHLGFHVSSISGAQIVNVEQFAHDLAQQNMTVMEPKRSQPSQNATNSSDRRSSEHEENYEDGADDGSADPEPADDTNNSGEVSAHVAESDDDGKLGKILSFNRPFTWALFDRFEVPIVAGVVTSLSPPDTSAPPAYSFLGMEGISSNAYLSCVQ